MASDINSSVEQEAIDNIASAGEDLADAVGSDIDGGELTDAAEAFAESLSGVSSVTADDLEPSLEDEYREAAVAGDEVVSHLISAGFFEAVDELAPPFDAEFLDDCLVHALGSAEEEGALYEMAGVEEDLPDFVSDAIENSEEIEDNVRWEPDKREKKASPMTTRGATEGAVDWLDDLGRHLWMSEKLLSDEMLADASDHTKGLGAGLLMVADGTAGLDGDSNPEDDLAKIVGGMAIHTYHQRRIPEHLSWITDDMRAPAAWAGD